MKQKNQLKVLQSRYEKMQVHTRTMYGHQEFALNVKRYMDYPTEESWKKQLVGCLGRALTGRELEYLHGGPLEYVGDTGFHEQFLCGLRDYALEVKEGCRITSRDYWDKVTALVKAEKKVPYPDLDREFTTEAKLAKLQEWRAQSDVEKKHLERLEQYSLEFTGQSAGWAILIGARLDAYELLDQAKASKDRRGVEESLSDLRLLLDAVDWFFGELKEINDSADFNCEVAHYFEDLLRDKDPNRFRFALNSTGEVTAENFDQALQKAEKELTLFLRSRVFSLSIEDDYGKVITPVKVANTIKLH